MLLLLLVTIFLSVWVKKNAYQVLYMSIYYEWYGSSYVIYIYIYSVEKTPAPIAKTRAKQFGKHGQNVLYKALGYVYIYIYIIYNI